ncbi:hypothetical protein [Stutzerimonas xanthomarina]|uniref:hypothetical protein n=1 Tax=Stutzerimonas xanthomarina TaxID=271420 RepID=UPI003AA7ADD0
MSDRLSVEKTQGLRQLPTVSALQAGRAGQLVNAGPEEHQRHRLDRNRAWREACSVRRVSPYGNPRARWKAPTWISPSSWWADGQRNYQANTPVISTNKELTQVLFNVPEVIQDRLGYTATPLPVAR